MKWFSLCMSVLYIVLGCALLFTTVLRDVIDTYRSGLGWVLVGYGALRAGLWIRRWWSNDGSV
ncbi:MAG: hypothetical protein JNL43_13600 [Flavobacteriales bacterium]|nr:hypothetical protein [Flavobacteriales bacterium]